MIQQNFPTSLSSYRGTISNAQQFFAHLGPELFSFDITGQLEKIISPTLIIYGDQEPAVQISAPVYQKGIVNSKVKIIPQSGHFPFIEQPQQFNDIVESFWRRLPSD